MARARLPGLRDWAAKIGTTWAVTCFYMLQSPELFGSRTQQARGQVGVAAIKKVHQVLS
jgi:hypothetical protein